MRFRDTTATKERWYQAVDGGWYTVRTTGPDDDSPQYIGQGYSHECDQCYLNIAHTVARHEQNVREAQS